MNDIKHIESFLEKEVELYKNKYKECKTHTEKVSLSNEIDTVLHKIVPDFRKSMVEVKAMIFKDFWSKKQ